MSRPASSERRRSGEQAAGFALLLRKHGIQPYPDRITDFLPAEEATDR
jgi:hypothetical protein